MTTFKAVLAALAVLFAGTFVAGFILGASNISTDSIFLAAFAIVGVIAVPLASRLVPNSSPRRTTAYTMGVVAFFLVLSPP